MNYSMIVNDLNNATLFDLYRLHVAISNELDRPSRIKETKLKLKIGMEISYFHSSKNRLVNAAVIELRNKNLVILDLEQNKKFLIPYYMVNVDNTETSIHEKKQTLTINNLKVGDCVGFNKDGVDIIGVIQRLNQKTVTLYTDTMNKWRVSYSLLYRVHDVNTVNENLLISTSSTL